MSKLQTKKGGLIGRPFCFTLLQILLYPLHRLNHILAMAEGRQPEEPFPARAETGTGRADHVALVDGFVEERKDHVSARRNSIEMHTKSL